MSRDDINDLLLGAVVVVLGYALYKHFKQPQGAPVPTGMGIAVGETISNGSTGPASPFTTIRDLLTGTVHDIGGFEGKNYLAVLEGNPW